MALQNFDKASFQGCAHRPRRAVHEPLGSFYDRKASKKPYCRSCRNEGILYDDLGLSMYCPCETGEEREEAEMEREAA